MIIAGDFMVKRSSHW